MHSAMVPGTEFTRPVEHIMRCDDFKSNFARKLSTRYTNNNNSQISAPPAPDPIVYNSNNSSARYEPCSAISESVGKQEKPDGDSGVDTNENMGVACTSTSVIGEAGAGSVRLAAINMEMDTLRWQLAQTEANRQMHIALLKQVVSVLNRVKEHIECQKEEMSSPLAAPLAPPPSTCDLSRACSVFHLSTPALAHPLARITGSLNSVDNGIYWNDSMPILTSDNNSKQRMGEEIARLICLANAVLDTKLPELSCWCANDKQECNQAEAVRPTFYAECVSSSLTKDSRVDDSVRSIEPSSTINSVEKRNYCEQYNFIEDESGFSSMSSFQEIGIPIINIIPSSPCEEPCHLTDTTDAPPSASANTVTTTSAATATDAVHVFWV